MKIFNREPAILMALAASIISFIGAFVVHLSDGQQTVLNAVVAAVFGLIAAWGLSKDRLVPAIMGVAQAVLNVTLAFGLHLSAERQSIIMGLVSTLVAALIVRPQVTAKVPA